MKPVETILTSAVAGGRRADGGSRPVADYGSMADCNSAALIDRDGSIGWLCLPRYDGNAVFARIVDPDGGYWSIGPAASYESSRRYLPGTLLAVTTVTTDSGTVKLTDAMVFASGQPGHDLGYDAPHEVVRSVEGVSGEVELVLELAPRPEYGLIKPLIRRG
jgi:alpha,alpha-trehalase